MMVLELKLEVKEEEIHEKIQDLSFNMAINDAV